VLWLATPSALLPEAPPEYTADTAKAKIAELKADKEFAERYLSGEVKATEEFKRLHGIASGKQAETESGLHRSMQFDSMPCASWRRSAGKMFCPGREQWPGSPIRAPW
jgi:hypothetical protein